MTYFCPPAEINVGDSLVLRGLQNRLGPGPILRYGEVADCDTLIVCGTPWLWDHCHASKKYADLKAAAARAKRVHAYGIGACFSSHDDYRRLALNNPSNDAIRKLWSTFEYIEVRDRLAKAIFDHLGIACTLARCPSVHSIEGLPRDTRGDVLIPYDPSKGLSRSTLKEGFMRRWTEHFRVCRDLLRNPTVLAVTEADQIWAMTALELDAAPLWTMEVETVVQRLAQADRVVTGRIHMGLPALAAGKHVQFFGCDTRVMTAEHAGGRSVWVH